MKPLVTRTRHLITSMLVSGATFAALGSAHAAEMDAAARGKAVFVVTCAPCHGDGPGAAGRKQLPGTSALQIKYQGRLPALLEQRNDLPTPLLKQYLRFGSWSMPPFRKSELSDANIADIAAYLAESSKASAR
jgi:(+)-pinoresinol hydroxylase